MIKPQPTVLEGGGIRLEPLTDHHRDALAAVAADGELWNLWFTSVPDTGATQAYIADALKGQSDGHMLPWVVRDLASNTIVGTTRYHDILAAIDRVEIGYTWYAQSRQRTNVNTT
jgi:RimJ/RimL family protein N-acetyltransferase